MKKKRLEKYLSGGEAAASGTAPVTDYGVGTLVSMATTAVADMIETLKTDVTPYHLQQNPYATGGMVEVEGKEMFETPQGGVGEFKGPSHENGGIDVALKDGTKIYSKRVKGPDGKTMAERKKRRENYLNNVTKKFVATPTDRIARNTLERAGVTTAMEDMHDVAVMEAMRATDAMTQKFADGGIVEVKKGDTLWGIGKAQGVSWEEIAKANNISDPRSLQVGTKLRIPGKQTEPTYSGGNLPEATVTAKRNKPAKSPSFSPVSRPSLSPAKGITKGNQTKLIRPTVAGSYRSGDVSPDQLTQFRSDHPEVNTIVLLRGQNEGVSKKQLENLGFKVKYLPIGNLSGKGEKANFRKAVDAVKQGNAIVMCKHGYDRTGAVCAQAALETGYNMDDVIEHNFWKEGKNIYPNVSGKGKNYAPYMEILETPETSYRNKQLKPVRTALRRYAQGGITENEVMEEIYKCGGIKKMQTGGIANGGDPTNPVDYEERLRMFRQMRDNPSGFDPRTPIMPQEDIYDYGPSGIPATIPQMPLVNSETGTGPYTIKQPQIATSSGMEILPPEDIAGLSDQIPSIPVVGEDFMKNLVPEPSGITPEEAVGDVNEGMTVNPDDIGFAGTAISAVGPMAMTLGNRLGDEPTPNFMEGFGSDALATYEKSLQALKQAEEEAKRGNTRIANRLRRQAANNLRGVGQQMSNYMGIAAQEGTQAGQIGSQFAQVMAEQLRGLAGTELQVDAQRRAGRERAFTANQQDRDNFYTQLNADLVNLGTGVQKTAADLNTQQLNEDFLSLLPELSTYGIGIRRKKTGGYELYNTNIKEE